VGPLHIKPLKGLLGCTYIGKAVSDAALFQTRTLRMRMTRNEWLLRFGECTVLENTPDNLMNLLASHDRLSLVVFVWSEFDEICPEEDYYAGTRWKEIVPHAQSDASRFYLREKPFFGVWTLVSGEFVGPRNRNFYRCERCGHEWIDEYPGEVDDECDQCGCGDWSPWRVEDLDAVGNVVQVREFGRAV
jgi:hypothetical protein